LFAIKFLPGRDLNFSQSNFPEAIAAGETAILPVFMKARESQGEL
jgi:hypothetical protein